MGYYFLTVKRKCKREMVIMASLVLNRNERYNPLINLYELRLYLEIPVTIDYTKLIIYSQSDIR